MNFNEAETNFRTYTDQILGFPSKYMVLISIRSERTGAQVNLFSAQGKVGDQERRVLSGSSNLGGCAVDDVYEFAIPCRTSVLHRAIRLGSRLSSRGGIHSPTATAWTPSAARPAEMVLPDLEEWSPSKLDDAVGDETGDGDYVTCWQPISTHPTAVCRIAPTSRCARVLGMLNSF